MNLRLNQDLWSGGLFVAAGSTFAMVASGYEIGSATQMGTGYFPLCIGILLTLLGLFLVSKTWRKEGKTEIVDLRLRAIVFIFAALLVFAFVLRPLGLPLASFITFAISAKADPTTPLRQILLAGAALAMLVYLVFIVGLALPIPAFPAI